MPQMRSVSAFLLVHTITGMCLVASSLVIARVAWKPFVPGITTSIRMRSGFSLFDLAIASSPFSAVTHWKPCLDSTSMKNWRSVGESSTIRLFLMGMGITSSGFHRRVRAYGLQQAVLGERLGQIFVGSDHAAARAIEQAVLRGQHDHRHRGEARVLLDERAGLVTVQTRHHDVAEDDVRLMVADLRKRVEAILGE